MTICNRDSLLHMHFNDIFSKMQELVYLMVMRKSSTSETTKKSGKLEEQVFSFFLHYQLVLKPSHQWELFWKMNNSCILVLIGPVL